LIKVNLLSKIITEKRTENIHSPNKQRAGHSIIMLLRQVLLKMCWIQWLTITQQKNWIKWM